MAECNQNALEQMVRQVLLEKLGIVTMGVKKISLQTVQITESDRMDTGNPGDRVWTKDLFTLEEAPRMGAGLMVMERTRFPWTLNYDEMDYVIEGRLTIHNKGQSVTAGPGELIYIPKGSEIEFDVADQARFLYVVYPADWQQQQ